MVVNPGQSHHMSAICGTHGYMTPWWVSNLARHFKHFHWTLTKCKFCRILSVQWKGKREDWHLQFWCRSARANNRRGCQGHWRWRKHGWMGMEGITWCYLTKDKIDEHIHDSAYLEDIFVVLKLGVSYTSPEGHLQRSTEARPYPAHAHPMWLETHTYRGWG